uniref:Uncharacterized protein n=1 Tax=Moniliophthora roreri TaxID=221103 RepID=A0A0W0G9R1_MONRR
MRKEKEREKRTKKFLGRTNTFIFIPYFFAC